MTRTRRLAVGALPVAAIAAAVLGFSGAWRSGTVVLDGPGTVLWVDLVRRHGLTDLVEAMWAGTTPWALASWLPIAPLAVAAKVVGSVGAVKLSVLAAQVVAGSGMSVLVSSLWRSRWTAAAAGIVYALHPLLVAHAALFGHVPTAWVLASLPWFVLSLRGLAASGRPGWVVGSAATGAFAVLQQPQHAPGLAVLAACVVGAEAMASPGRAPRLLLRTTAAATLAAALSAVWLVPFLGLGRAFALNPERLVQAQLVHGDATQLGQVPQAFLTRSAGWTTPDVSFTASEHFANGTYYLGLLVVVLALAGILLLPWRDRRGGVAAITLAGAVCLWASGASVPLARSALVDAGPAAFAVIGVAMGVVLGTLVGRLRRPAAVAAVLAASLAAAPYVAPFLALRRVLPFAEALRFPRLYPVAVFALVVVAALPVAAVERWASRRRHTLLAPAACAIVVAVALVDASPYRSAYRLGEAPHAGAYAAVARTLPGEGRVATREWWDPVQSAPFLRRGRELATGWPHPVALAEQWQLAAGTWSAPRAYTLRALGLSATTSVVHDRWHAQVPGLRREHGLWITPNANALGAVRAYERVAVVPEHPVAAEVAVEVASRGIGVVDAEPGRGIETVDDAEGEVASARARRRWVTHGAVRWHRADGRRSVGARFRAGSDGLRAVALALDRPPGRAELVLTEGRRTVARARTSGEGEDGLWRFPFPAVAASGGRRFTFALRCPSCPSGRGPGLGSVQVSDGGDLVVDGRRDTGRAATYYPVYAELTAPPPPTAAVRVVGRTRTGRWTIDADLRRPSLVVVATAAFPGWTATVDGRPAPVRRADGAFVGVPVPAGHHTVRIEHEPAASVIAGRATSVAAVLLSVLLLFGARRQRRTAGSGSSETGSATTIPSRLRRRD